MFPLKKGSKGQNVKTIQTYLKLVADGIFGPKTEQAVKAFQTQNGLVVDGIVGTKTWTKMGLGTPVDTSSSSSEPIIGPSGFDERYKNKVYEGSTFPDKPYSSTLKVILNSSITDIYLPAFDEVLPTATKGVRMLLTIMAFHEGFYKTMKSTGQPSLSFRTNNPGNIGNTDNGTKNPIPTLAAGILRQKEYIDKIIAGKNANYPMNKQKYIAPSFSKEISENVKNYGMSPWLPGYNFVFTGQLDQYVKIYSTGARAGNSYINTIVSYFAANGIVIRPESKIQEIILME